MTIAKCQHWVPQFYLRYFADPESRPGAERVWIFHRKHGNDPKLTNIKNIAAENHLYTPRREDGIRDPAMENKLQRLEGSMAKLWPRLANDFVDLKAEGIRKGIALYLSVQFLRHPDRRNSIVDFRRRLIDLIRDDPRDSQGRPLTERIQVGQQVFTIRPEEWDEIEHSGPDRDTNRWIEFIQDGAIGIAEILMAKRWSIVFIEEPLFVTSDFPLFVVSQEHKRHQVGGNSAVIMFPLSPTRILCFDDLDAPANQYYKLPNKEADVYNMLTWVNTESFMISPRNVYDVLAGIGRLKEEFEATGGGVASDESSSPRLD